jgi:hypothetical protein
MLVPVAKPGFIAVIGLGLGLGLGACRSEQTLGMNPSGGSMPAGPGAGGAASGGDGGVADARAFPDAAIADGSPRPDVAPRPDAPGVAGGRIIGHVCALSSVLAARACVPATNSLASVEAAGATTTVSADGSFALDLPASAITGAPIQVNVLGDSAFVPSAALISLDAQGNASADIQMITVELAANLEQTNGQGGTTFVLVTVDDAGQPAADVTAANLLDIPAAYDDGDPVKMAQVPPTHGAGTIFWFLPFGNGGDDVTLTLGDRTASVHVFSVSNAFSTARVSF